LLDQFGDQAGPAGLMASAQTSAVITMEIFMEENQIPPMGIALEVFDSPI
jgi:hypothetical protein